MITFLCGTLGSGKTTRVIECIKTDIASGRKVFLIVPEQEAVSAEHRILNALPASSQLDIEVLNFSRLYNRVCREYGGLSYKYATKPVKHLLMWQNLRELAPLLEAYGELASNDTSLSDLMLSAINEFKACAVPPSELERIANKLGDNDPLKKKLNDLSLIYASFENLLSQRYSDSSDDLAKLYDKLTKHDFFRGASVYIDSFFSFTAVEHKVIERIFASSESVTVTVPLHHPESLESFDESIRRSFRALKRNAEKHGGYEIQTLHGNRRAVSPSIAYLTENLWRLDVSKEDNGAYSDGSIIMEKCENTYAEAEAVSAHILELLRGGARCKEIAVIMRAPSAYRGIIEPAFEKNGIPFFISDKTELCSLAPVKLILSALRIRRFNWQKADVIAYVKTGLCFEDSRKVDLFEEYVNTWNIRGQKFTDCDWTMNPDGYQSTVTARGNEILSSANEVRRAICKPLIKLFVLLDACENVGDMCRAIYSYLCEISLEERLSALALRQAQRGQVRLASELSSAYSVIINTLADIGEAMKDEQADTEELFSILKTMFDATDIGSIPTSIDEVNVGSVVSMRTSCIKYAFVLGLCESLFPASIRDSGVFSTSDREKLSLLELELSGDSDTRCSDELLYVLKAFSTPSDKLYLFTTEGELGSRDARIPSLAFNRVRALFPSIEVHKYDGADLKYLVSAPKSAVSHLRSLKGSAEGRALELAASPYLQSLDVHSSSNSFSPTERLSDKIISNPKYDDMVLSFSKFERYVTCPFKYFCSTELKLRETGRAKFELNNIGTFVHHVLEHLLRYAVTELDDGSLPTRDMITEKGNMIVDEYIDSLFPFDDHASGRLQHLFIRLKNLSRLVIENLLCEMEHSKFRPAFFELDTNGKGENPMPMVFIPEDKSYRVTFTGIIDRVDVMKKDDKVYIRVVDYKTGSKTFTPDDLEHGMNLQMLLYLCTLCRNRDNDFARSLGLEAGKTATPAGMVYLLARIPVISLDDYAPDDEILKKASDSIERNGLLLGEEEILRAMNDELSSSFLAGISEEKGALLGDALTSQAHFEELFTEMEKVILKITSNIRSGYADARPLQYNGKIPCDYCEAKSVCRYTEKHEMED